MNAVIERNRPKGFRDFVTLAGIVAALALLVKILFVVWAAAALITTMADDQAFAKKDYTTQMQSMDRRVTALEVAKGASDQQQASTGAAISGLQAQTNAMQSSLNDMRDGIRAIQTDIANMARIANAPLPGGRR